MSVDVRQKALFPVFILMVVLFFSSACQILPAKPASEVLRQRIEGYMGAKVAEDWEAVYEYFLPSDAEGLPKSEFLKKKKNMKVLQYEIQSIEVLPSGEEATARVEYATQVQSFEFKGIIDTQKWLKRNNKWYLKADLKAQKPF
jgi:hypothetical protein